MQTVFSIVTVLNEAGNPIKIACVSNLPGPATLTEMEAGAIRSNPGDNAEGNPSAE